MNELIEVMTEKSKDQYKIIEDRYYTLRRYLRNWFEHNSCMKKEDAELILDSLEPIYCEDVEESDNE